MKTILATLPAAPSSSSPAPSFCGTEEGSKIWYNTSDPGAMVLSGIVWILILFSVVVCVQVVLLHPQEPRANIYLSYGVISLCFMGWLSHAVCMLSDPGIVPSDAKPLPKTSSSFRCYNKDELVHDYLDNNSIFGGNESHDDVTKKDIYSMIQGSSGSGSGSGSGSSLPSTISGDEEDLCEHLQHLVCGMCDSYKPPFAHHDRMSGRCISRMDHFCPWTNNAIGAKNQKSFILFIAYTDLASLLFCLILYNNWISCSSVSCSEDPRHRKILLVQMIILLFSVVFTTSMLVTQIYNLMTGVGTIDRMQMRKNQADVFQPIPFNHVFGDEAPYRWFIPTEPRFENVETVLLYRRTLSGLQL